jgi:hypothetical protein
MFMNFYWPVKEILAHLQRVCETQLHSSLLAYCIGLENQAYYREVFTRCKLIVEVRIILRIFTVYVISLLDRFPHMAAFFIELIVKDSATLAGLANICASIVEIL